MILASKQATSNKRWDILNKALDSLQETIDRFPENNVMTVFIEEILTLINHRVKVPRIYDLAFSEDLVLNIKAYNLLIEVLRAMQNTCNSLNLQEIMTKNSFYQEFITLLKETELRLNVNGQTKLCDLNELRNGEVELEQYKAIFILGLAEGMWPKRRSNSWLLSENDRAELNRLGFWNKSKKYMEDEETEIFLKILEAPVANLFFYYPQKVEGKLLGPSSLLTEFLPAEKVNYAKDYRANDDYIIDKSIPSPNELNGCHSSHQHQGKIARSENKVFSVSEINTYAYCPAMYLFRYLWGLKEAVRENNLFNISLGKICHRVLESYLQTQNSLDKVILASIKEFREENPFFLPTFYRKAEKTCVRYMNNWVAKNWQNEVTINGNIRERLVEWSFGLEHSTEPALLVQSKRGTVKLKGQIDRIDINNQGKAMVYDYKLGSPPDIKDILNQEELQVPLYLLAFQKLRLKKDYKVVGGAYYSLKRGLPIGICLKESEERPFAVKGQTGALSPFEWENYFLTLQEKVLEIAALINSKQFPRRSNLGKECFRLCSYRSICNS